MKPKTATTPATRLIMPIGLIFLLVLSGIIFRYDNYVHHASSIDEILVPVSTDSLPIAFNTIGVGMVASNIYNFDAGKKTFDADGWVWLTWSPEIEKHMKARAMSAQDLFFFFNGVDDYDFSLVPDSTAPLRFPDGRYYQKYRYSGHFYAHDLNFRRYPFQTISLPLALELKSIDLLGTETPLSVVLDHEHSGVGSYIEIAGYVKKGFTFSSYLHKYISSQGEPGLLNGVRSLYQARMEVAYGKAPMATVIKLLIPLITVMAIILLSTLIPLKGWEVRLAIPPTVILTLIFLQQAYQANLPDLPYITFLDCLYNMSYLSALMIFGLYLWGSMEYHISAEEDPEKTMVRIQKVDRQVLLALTIFFPIGTWVNWTAMGLPWH
jgi:hypothetical protein